MRSVIAPKPTSFSSVSGVFENLRIVMHEPRSASGRMTAFTREPSLRRASTSGDDSSMRRPSGVTMRSMTARTRSSSVKRASRQRELAAAARCRSCSGSTTMISVMVGSARKRSSGPRPSASSASSPMSASRSMLGGMRVVELVDDAAERVEHLRAHRRIVELLRRRSSRGRGARGAACGSRGGARDPFRACASSASRSAAAATTSFGACACLPRLRAAGIGAGGRPFGPRACIGPV